MSRNTPNAAEEFSARARAFAQIHVGQRTEAFAANLHTRVELLQVGEMAMPTTVNDGERDNAWVCSPRTTYADYASEEAARYLPAWLARPARWLCTGVGAALARAGIDRAVTVNNWLLSTNLYPPLACVPLPALIESARARWPGHALWFRSLNLTDNRDWLDGLRDLGFQLVASRQVYLFDNLPALVARHINQKRDLALLAHTPLQRIGNDDIVAEDYARIAELYGLLYIQKYSRFNPYYNAEFMRRWHRAGLLEFDGFRDEAGQLQGVIGLFRQGTTLTAPIVGYNTGLSQRLGLYRLLTACAYQAAMRRGYRLNFSAGAADFKRVRGGIPSIEYSAVSTLHLPRRTRCAVDALSLLTCRVGAPLMTRYKL